MLLVFECDSYREASILNMQQTEKYFTLYILIFGATGSRCVLLHMRGTSMHSRALNRARGKIHKAINFTRSEKLNSFK